MRDLRVAAGICRLKPFDSRVRKPWLLPAWIYVGFILGSVLGAKARRQDPARLQRALKKHCDAFSEYAKAYLQEPEYCIIPPSRRPGQDPPESRGRFHDIIEHVGELITWGGLSAEKRIWGMPLGAANVYRIIARRAAGNDVEIVSEEEKEFQKSVPPQFRKKKP